MEQIAYPDFEKVDIRVGRVVKAEDFPEAKNPAYKIEIDFGKGVGLKKSSAQITGNYKKDELVGKQVLAVVNFPPRRIGNFMSEVLTLGVPKDDLKDIVLVKPEMEVPLGGRMY